MPTTTIVRRNSGGFVEIVKTIVYAVVIAVAVRTIAFEPFNIPSASMIPTLLVGDYLFVSKYSYGYSKYSLPLSPNMFSGRILGRLPRRGDVAVFKFPSNPSIDYIKRIVGLPGDRIQMKAGLLYINGEELGRDYVEDIVAVDEHEIQTSEKEYSETLPGGRVHLIAKTADHGGKNDTEEYVVPPDHVFGMGDNRDNSSDSRFSPMDGGVGFIPVENLVGRAEFVFFSIEQTAPWWQVWEWPGEIRWSRLMSGIR